MATDAFELFESGELELAIAAAIDRVKNEPTDVANRFFLAELYCFAGLWEKADKQLNTLAQQEEKAAHRTNLLRHLIRAEISREQFFSEGRVPELVSDPSEVIANCLKSSIAIRDNDHQTAAGLLSSVEMKRPKISGKMDGEAFSDIRDLDDLTSSFFEVLTSTGKYYWVPVEDIVSIEFRAPETVKDLLWRGVNISVDKGLDGEVYVPVRYAGSQASDEQSLRMGRGTIWTDPENGYVRGIGQREFLIGENVVPILELKQLEFESASDL